MHGYQFQTGGDCRGLRTAAFRIDDNRGRFTLVASKNGRDHSVTVHQDIDLWAASFASGEEAAFRLKPERQAWIQATRGNVTINGTRAGDGAAVNQEEILEFNAADGAEMLLFDLL